MNLFNLISMLTTFSITIFFLTGGVILLFYRKKLRFLKAVDKLFIFGWWLVFTSFFVDISLRMLTHLTLFYPGEAFVWGVILFIPATILWLAYRVFRASLDAEKRKTISKSR